MNWEIKEYYDEYSSDNPNFYIARQTLKELILYCDDKGITFVGNNTIAKNTKQSERTVSRHIKTLEELGIVETVKKGGTTTAIRKVKVDIDKTLVGHKVDIDKTQGRQASDKQVTQARHCIDKQVTSKVSNEDKIIREEEEEYAPSCDGTLFCSINNIKENEEQPNYNKHFNIAWNLHSDALRQLKTKYGKKRRNSNKEECRARFNKLSNKYGYKTLLIYTRAESLRATPRELLNLYGKSCEYDVLEFISKNGNDSMNDELLECDEESFINTYNEIMEQI